MTVHIGLLRAVNLAGINKVRMSDLCELVAGAGMQDVHSVLQSGNIVFKSRGLRDGQLEALLEREAKKGLGLTTDFFVRTADEWDEIIEANPFTREAKEDPSHLVVLALKKAPAAEHATALQRAIVNREVAHVKGRHAYVVYPDGIGRSRLTSAVIERALGTPTTARNWNTVRKIAALARR